MLRKLGIIAVILMLPWSAMAQSNPVESEVPAEDGGYRWLAIGAGIVGGVVAANFVAAVFIFPLIEVAGLTGLTAGASPPAVVAAGRTMIERTVRGISTVVGAAIGGWFGNWAYES